jgi:hypothetical protein
MSEPTVTTRGFGGTLRLAGQPDLPVTVLLRHTCAEPSAVRAVAVLDEDSSVDLLLERSLLTAGLDAPAEDGDVRVSSAGGDVLVEVGPLGLVLALADVVDLLLATYQAAPAVREQDLVIALHAPAEQVSRA